MNIKCLRCGYIHREIPNHCQSCGAQLGSVGDGVPTQGEQYESELSSWRCTCGEPSTPGVVHRTDAPCYYLEATNS